MSAAPAQPPSILVIEHEASARLLIAAVLAECGYRVIEATSEGEALQTLGQENVAAVLLDPDSPELEGRAIFLAYRPLRGPRAALVVCPPVDRSRGDTVLTVMLIEKPFSRDILIHAIQRSLGSARHHGFSGGPGRAADDLPKKPLIA